MSFNIDKGLFNSDFIDHHAVLGIPVDADQKGIRKRYLKIARRLHPDSSDLKTAEDRRLASEYLSKLVNPAYEYLSQEKNYSEHQIILKLKGQQAQRQQDTIVLSTDRARQLASTGNASHEYQTALQELSEQQYQSLNSTLEVIGRISELNLVYLMRTSGDGNGARPAVAPPSTGTSGSTAAPSPAAARPTPPPPSKDTLIESFVRRAEEFERQQNYAKAILELREALKLKPQNSNCHSRLGMIYVKTKQPKMARIHFDKALEINPNDELAGAGRQMLERTGAVPPSNANGTTKRSSASGNNDTRGGLFGLFGGRKK